MGSAQKSHPQRIFLSFEWILFYGLVLLCLRIYAVLWQPILKKVNLNIAFESKAVTLIWLPLSMAPIPEASVYIFVAVLSYVFLKEKMTKKQLIGMGLILTGIVVYSLKY